MRANNSKRILATAAIMLLIMAVAALSVVATHDRYLPESDPAHFLPTATKMNVAPPVVFAPPPVYVFTKVTPDQSGLWTSPFQESAPLDLRQIGLTVSLQHRSPPSLVA